MVAGHFGAWLLYTAELRTLSSVTYAPRHYAAGVLSIGCGTQMVARVSSCRICFDDFRKKAGADIPSTGRTAGSESQYACV